MLTHTKAWRKILHFVSFNLQEQFFSRNPLSSYAEAIYIKGDHWHVLIKAYISTLLASGFNQNGTAFTLTPCPLGTFRNILTKGVDGCQYCPPGNF